MFFVASKVLAFAVIPSNILIALIVVGAVLLGTRFARAGRRLLLTGIVLIVIVGFSPVGIALMRGLEDRFPPWDAGTTAPTGFIVLGGAIDGRLSNLRHAIALGDDAERITVTAELARRFPSARFIFSGGSGRLFGGPAEADYAVALMESFGIARDRITAEGQSRNTEENAVFSNALAMPKAGERWVIVTSAVHMPRAIGAFRAVGFDVEAYPVDWRTRGAADAWSFFTSFTSGLMLTDLAMREYVGLLAYRLTGRTSELFPGPR